MTHIINPWQHVGERVETISVFSKEKYPKMHLNIENTLYAYIKGILRSYVYSSTKYKLFIHFKTKRLPRKKNNLNKRKHTYFPFALAKTQTFYNFTHFVVFSFGCRSERQNIHHQKHITHIHMEKWKTGDNWFELKKKKKR